jgi:hypothetical protein
LNFNDLQNRLLNYYYLFYYLGHLHYPLHYSRNHYDLLYDLLNLNYPWHLHNLLYNALHNLRLNFDNLLLNHNRHWLLNVNRLDDLFFDGNQFQPLHLQLFYPLRHVRHWNFVDYWHLLANIQRNNFVHLRIFACQNLADYGFVNVDLHLPNDFHLVCLYKMRPFYKNLFGSLPQKFLLFGDRNLLDHFLVFFDYDGLIPILYDFNNLYFRDSNLNWYFPVEINDLFMLYNVRDFLLYLNILGLSDNLRNPDLHLFNLLPSLIQINWLLDYLLNLYVFSSPSLYDLLDLLELHLLDHLLDFNLPHHLLTLIQTNWFLVHH